MQNFLSYGAEVCTKLEEGIGVAVDQQCCCHQGLVTNHPVALRDQVNLGSPLLNFPFLCIYYATS